MAERFSRVFSLLADLVMARGQHPLKQYDRPLHVPISDRWDAWINGQAEDRVIADGKDMAADCQVPAFSVAVFFNGWLAGFIDPCGGVLAAGEGANEDTLIAAIEGALAEFELKPRQFPAGASNVSGSAGETHEQG